MKVYVYDIETYPNIFTFVFRCVKTKQIYIFELSSRKWKLNELREFLRQSNIGLVGYNNVFFDYPILHYILVNKNITLEGLYGYVQRILNSEFPMVPEWKVMIPQVDLYKINHYDNKNRRTSLKWLEFTLRWDKLQDLPFVPGTIIPEDKFDFLIKYNINDVDFTLEFLGKCMDAIIFRQEMTKFLGVNVMNYSDVKIGEYLNRKTYQRLSGIPYSDFKELRTYRDIIQVSDLIPDYIQFKTENLRGFLTEISSSSFRVDEEWYRHLSMGNMDIKFAKGGLHSKDTPLVFMCKKGYKLKEKDVGSMYPKSIIEGMFYPAHLGPAWFEGIKILYEERLNELKPAMKKIKDRNSKEYKFLDSKQNAYKLAMNGGGYGKTGLQYSWQYDPMVMLKVTFKGQLSLLMLLEDYHEAGVEIISANTDGIVIHYPEEMEDEVTRIHKEWEKVTHYLLEDTSYARIISRDVNNYIADIIDEETHERVKMKFKGCFEVDADFHKNNSQRIVAIALMEYFINDIPVEDVICNPGYEFKNSKEKTEKTSIYDYCCGVKKGNGTKNYTFVSPQHREDISDKVVRYYISNSNTKIYKVYKSKKVAAITKGFYVTSFMDFEEKEEYNINYDYYINECKKIINPIELGTSKIDYDEPEQLTLF